MPTFNQASFLSQECNQNPSDIYQDVPDPTAQCSETDSFKDATDFNCAKVLLGLLRLDMNKEYGPIASTQVSRLHLLAASPIPMWHLQPIPVALSEHLPHL